MTKKQKREIDRIVSRVNSLLCSYPTLNEVEIDQVEMINERLHELKSNIKIHRKHLEIPKC
jgi:CHAD domain-containing protein